LERRALHTLEEQRIMRERIEDERRRAERSGDVEEIIRSRYGGDAGDGGVMTVGRGGVNSSRINSDNLKGQSNLEKVGNSAGINNNNNITNENTNESNEGLSSMGRGRGRGRGRGSLSNLPAWLVRKRDEERKSRDNVVVAVAAEAAVGGGGRGGDINATTTVTSIKGGEDNNNTNRNNSIHDDERFVDAEGIPGNNVGSGSEINNGSNKDENFNNGGNGNNSGSDGGGNLLRKHLERHADGNNTGKNNATTTLMGGGNNNDRDDSYGCTVRLGNLVSPGSVDDDLLDEVKEECEGRCGPVSTMRVRDAETKSSSSSSNIGDGIGEIDNKEDFRGEVRVYVTFRRRDVALRAVALFEGRMFGDRRINARMF